MVAPVEGPWAVSGVAVNTRALPSPFSLRSMPAFILHIIWMLKGAVFFGPQLLLDCSILGGELFEVSPCLSLPHFQKSLLLQKATLPSQSPQQAFEEMHGILQNRG